MILFHGLSVSQFTEDIRLSFLFSRWINSRFHRDISQTGQGLPRFQSHPWVVEIFLVVLIFSLSLLPRQRPSKMVSIDRLKIFPIQNHFVSLPWEYLQHHFSNQRESIRLFELLISRILRYQALMIEFNRDSEQMSNLNTLVKSILVLE